MEHKPQVAAAANHVVSAGPVVSLGYAQRHCPMAVAERREVVRRAFAARVHPQRDLEQDVRHLDRRV